MSQWIETGDGYRTKTVKKGNVTIVIHRPILSDKERIKRESLVENALTSYGRSLSQHQVINT